MREEYRFRAVLRQSDGLDAAYVVFPWDLRAEFGKGRLKVRATFDGAPYEGSVVNMGVKDADGNVCYIIGVTRAIRRAIHKTFGDAVDVVIVPQEPQP